MKSPTPKTETLSIDQLQARLATIRAQITANRQAHAHQAPALLPLADAKAQASQWLDRLAGAGSQTVLEMAQYFQHPDCRGADLIHPTNTHPWRLLESLLVFVGREAFEKALMTELEQLISEDRDSQETVQARLAALDAECAQMEREEERLIRTLEDLGVNLFRRADAPPQWVLADDQELLAA